MKYCETFAAQSVLAPLKRWMGRNASGRLGARLFLSGSQLEAILGIMGRRIRKDAGGQAEIACRDAHCITGGDVSDGPVINFALNGI